MDGGPWVSGFVLRRRRVLEASLRSDPLDSPVILAAGARAREAMELIYPDDLLLLWPSRDYPNLGPLQTTYQKLRYPVSVVKTATT
ncbi:hypothetical protein NDU88_005343 [Pleurodeles waltl]|uniref:Uncharacterized protein n=1 Tax=Pleurodeles waltl TaxID=8319 RepID=A0AAV7LL78_PLEWA|nr:hypothetical protein NDU88_005343 [Pleurodeles waltl]